MVKIFENSLQSEIYEGKGYSLSLKLSADELDLIYKIIRMAWLYRLQIEAPKLIKKFDAVGMSHYHKLANEINHQHMWPKYVRVLPREAVSLIKSMAFYRLIDKEFSIINISDEEDLGWENIYWRIVRPGNSDFGSLHADKWFWDIGEYAANTPSIPYERIKIWIAIDSVEGKNGLMVVPYSHYKKDWQWHVEEKLGRKKPIFDENIDEIDTRLLRTEAGRMVVFHDELIHGGAPNLAETTRISLEMTLFIHKR